MGNVCLGVLCVGWGYDFEEVLKKEVLKKASLRR